MTIVMTDRIYEKSSRLRKNFVDLSFQFSKKRSKLLLF